MLAATPRIPVLVICQSCTNFSDLYPAGKASGALLSKMRLLLDLLSVNSAERRCSGSCHSPTTMRRYALLCLCFQVLDPPNSF